MTYETRAGRGRATNLNFVFRIFRWTTSIITTAFPNRKEEIVVGCILEYESRFLGVLTCRHIRNICCGRTAGDLLGWIPHSDLEEIAPKGPKGHHIALCAFIIQKIPINGVVAVPFLRRDSCAAQIRPGVHIECT